MTSELRSSTPVRSARLRSASARGLPARSSRLIRRSSSDRSGYGERQLLADALQRLVEAEARFDADDQQVERVGERQADAVRAPLRQARQHHAGQDVAEAEAAERHRQVFGRAKIDAREQREQPEREGDADAEEDRQRLVAAEARPAPGAAAAAQSPSSTSAPSRRAA